MSIYFSIHSCSLAVTTFFDLLIKKKQQQKKRVSKSRDQKLVFRNKIVITHHESKLCMGSTDDRK